MSDVKIIKDGLLLSLDKESTTGFFDVVIKGDLISEVIPSENFDIKLLNERYPDAEIINAKGKLVLPGLINSNLNSSFILSRMFIKNNYYDSLHSIPSLKRLEKYFTNLNTDEDLYQLMTYAYMDMLMSGVTTLADVSSYPYRDFLKKKFSDNQLIKQNVIFTSYHFSTSTFFKYQDQFYLTGFKFEEELNNYSINSIKKNFHVGENKLYLDIFNSELYSEQVSRSFGKTLVSLFDEFKLLSENTIISNPISINERDIKTLGDCKVNVVFNPTDFIKLARKNIEFESIMNSCANASIGTGYYGRDLLSECRSFSKLIYKSKFKYSDILKMITINGAKNFNVDSFKGSISRNYKADIVFFDMSDIRNIPDIPGIDEELLSEYVIETFSCKDISDVMVSGEIVYSDKSVKGINTENLYFNTKELIKKIYKVSSYFEYKDSIHSRRSAEKILSKPVDSSQFRKVIHARDDEFNDSQDEFTIVGTQSMEIFDTVVKTDKNPDELTKFIHKIESFTNGFIYKTGEEQAPVKKIFFDDVSGEKQSGNETQTVRQIKEESEAEVLLVENSKPDIKHDSKTPESTTPDKVVLKKSKLKFGFSDDS